MSAMPTPEWWDGFITGFLFAASWGVVLMMFLSSAARRRLR